MDLRITLKTSVLDDFRFSAQCLQGLTFPDPKESATQAIGHIIDRNSHKFRGLTEPFKLVSIVEADGSSVLNMSFSEEAITTIKQTPETLPVHLQGLLYEGADSSSPFGLAEHMVKVEPV